MSHDLLRSTRPAEGATPLLAKGFRPFFLMAAAHAALAVPAWLLIARGQLGPPPHLPASIWHGHEMIFGFTVAVIGGFLLTAAGNWTKRETAVGLPLAALALLWLAGRVVSTVPVLPAGAAAVVDLLFLPALALTVGRVLWAARSRRNFAFPVILVALAVAQALVHGEGLHALLRGPEAAPAWLAAAPHRALAVAADLVVLVIVIITGRIVPLFTRNATSSGDVRSRPALDRAAIAAVVVLVALEAAWPASPALGWVAVGGGLLVGARAMGWGARRSGRDPLLWVLHVGHAWLVVGLLLRGAASLTSFVPPAAALHALTAGAIGTLTLGMMARVSLGHTGRVLKASRALGVAFASIVLAGLLRVASPFLEGAAARGTLDGSVTLWSLAFVLYLASFGRALVTARPDGKPG